jgi:hypothetical protein
VKSSCRKWARKWVGDLIRRGILFQRGVCEDGAAGGRSSSERRLCREPVLSSRNGVYEPPGARIIFQS